MIMYFLKVCIFHVFCNYIIWFKYVILLGNDIFMSNKYSFETKPEPTRELKKLRLSRPHLDFAPPPPSQFF